MSYYDGLLDILCDRYELFDEDNELALIQKFASKKECQDRYKIAHFIYDSIYCQGFLDLAVNAKETEHVFLIPIGSFKYIDLTSIRNVQIVRYDPKYILDDTNVLNSIRNSDVIAIQFAFPFLMDMAIMIKQKYGDDKLITWTPWGGDIWPYCFKSLIDYKSLSVIRQVLNPDQIDNMSNSKLYRSKSLQVFLNSIDVIYLPIEGANLLSSIYDCSKIVIVDNLFHNPTSLDIQEEFEDVVECNKYEIKIVLGNSMTPENNHISAIHSIASQARKSKYKYEVSIMASYGFPKNSWYYNLVKIYAQRMFSGVVRYTFVDNFMTKHDYKKFLSKHEIMYLNHVRGQAASSTLTAIGLNLKILLPGENIRFKIFERLASYHNKSDIGLYPNESYSIDEIFEKSKVKDINKCFTLNDYQSMMPLMSTFNTIFR